MGKTPLLTVLLLASFSVLRGDQCILSNPDFSAVSGGKVIGWELARPVPPGFSGPAAAELGEMPDGRGFRIVQRGLSKGLAPLYGHGLEMEYSVILKVEEASPRARLLIYFESIPDKFCALADLREYPVRRSFRVRVRFRLPDKPLKAPTVNVWLRGKGRVLASGAYLGPVNIKSGRAPVLPGEKTDLVWTTAGAGRYAWTVLPSRNDLLTGGTDLGRWRFAGGAGYDGNESVVILPRPGAEAAIPVSLGSAKKGADIRFTMTVSNNSDPSTRFAVGARFVRDGKLLAFQKSPAQTVYVGWETRHLQFTVPDGSPDQVTFSVRNVSGDTVKFSSASYSDSPPEKRDDGWYQTQTCYARVTDFPARNTYLLPDVPKKLSLEILPAAPVLDVELKEIGGPVLQKIAVTGLVPGVPARRELRLPPLAAGAYELVFTGDGMPGDTEFFRIRSLQVRGVNFDRNGWLLLNGKPFFPIMMNHIPTSNSDFFRVAAASGINTVCFLQDLQNRRGADYALAQAKKHDLAVVDWVNQGDWRGSPEKLAEFLRRMKPRYDAFPKFIGLLSDETAARNVPPDRVLRNNRVAFRELPDYILWENHAPRIDGKTSAPKKEFLPYIRRFSTTFDVLSVDIYPVPAPGVAHNRLANRRLSCVGDYTVLARAAGWNRKPVWMILQAWGWGENTAVNRLDILPRPDYRELRFMAWNAILRGATGIDWHSEGRYPHRYGPCDEIYGDWWADFAWVNRELAAAGKILAGSTPLKLPGKFPEFIAAKAWKNGERVLFAAVNELDHPAVAGFTCPLSEKLYNLRSGKEYHGEPIRLEAYGVILLSTERTQIHRVKFSRQDSGPSYCENRNITLPADWIMPAKAAGENLFRGTFDVPTVPADAKILFNTNSAWTLYVNGNEIDRGDEQRKLFEYCISPWLRPGKNVITMKCVTRGHRKTGLVWTVFGNGGDILMTSGAETLSSAGKLSDFVPCKVIGPHRDFPKWKYKGCLEFVPQRPGCR